MKTGAAYAALLLAGVAWSSAANAASAEQAVATPNAQPGAGQARTPVSKQLIQLREQAGIVRPAPATPVKAEDGSEAVTEGTLVLEPMVVDEKRAIVLPAPPLRENTLQQVLRTGTLWERVGARFTRRWWVDGGKGAGFTFSW